MHSRLLFLAIITLLTSLCRGGELIQRWEYVHHQPYWHRFERSDYRPVLFPQHDVILQYNCYWMPATCRNARNWMEDSRKSQWGGREANDTFTYDFAAFHEPFSRRRRDSCPYDWSDWPNGGNRCPEKDQPPVMPGPWINFGLETQDPRLYMEIRSTTDANYTAQSLNSTGRSGRQYACQEFPSSAWLEGGDETWRRGPPPKAIGVYAKANTYCVPQGVAPNCALSYPGIYSERDWLETTDRMLGGRLFQQVMPRYVNVSSMIVHNDDDCARFKLELIDDPTIGPSRVLWKPSDEGNGIPHAEGPSKHPNYWHERLGKPTTSMRHRQGYLYDEVILEGETYKPVINMSSSHPRQSHAPPIRPDPWQPEDKYDSCLPTFPNAQRPNSTLDQMTCFDGGWLAVKREMIETLHLFCQNAAGKYLNSQEALTIEEVVPTRMLPILRNKIVLSVKMKQGCEYRVRDQECRTMLTKLVKGCPVWGKDYKRGGTIENNCLEWKIDPDY
ncbi:hypothetical protein CP533_5917 [Ophiocordyceps camponoti-saundersi (nom. inval.)]|nr:hypothetical protein CP533_5917 [Ophiocordyceps camponoti-saundersi (nom. inval.)]